MGIPQIQQQEIARRKNRENSPSQPGKVRCGFFLTAANQQPEKNPGNSRNCPWHFRKIGYNRSVPQGDIEDLCNGSTPDSDSVCGGSNPSSSAIKTRYPSGYLVFILVWDSNQFKCRCPVDICCNQFKNWLLLWFLPAKAVKNVIESLILCH